MTMRDVEGVIAEAVEAGRLNGMDGLNNWQRTVFLIAEAELLCDMGADFADDYAAEFLADRFAAAFRKSVRRKLPICLSIWLPIWAILRMSRHWLLPFPTVWGMTIARWRITFPAVWIGRLKEMSDALTHSMRHKRRPVYFIAGRSYISAESPLL